MNVCDQNQGETHTNAAATEPAMRMTLKLGLHEKQPYQSSPAKVAQSLTLNLVSLSFVLLTRLIPTIRHQSSLKH